MSFISGLPIDGVLPEIIDTLKKSDCLVISAEPGAGKSTVIPLALLDAGINGNSKIIMLEPRRIAARACAERMAETLGTQTGKVVGYRTALESRVSKETKIEVVTEGVLANMIRRDPELADVSCVIFDEFHERSIHADLALALSCDVRENLRDDLKIIVMSATIDTQKVSALLGNAPVITSPGRCFEVKTIYSDTHRALDIWDSTANAVSSALKSFPGDVLAFLPGEYEIRRCHAALSKMSFPFEVEVLPLYGTLPTIEQDKVFSSHSDNIRRVVLATSIAETSLTLPSVKIVVDSGFTRSVRFSVANGMDSLETLRVSRASADQRKGRAGRVTEGICIRLWNEMENNAIEDFTPSEILKCDLARFALQLADWGVNSNNIGNMKFIDYPAQSTLSGAYSLLAALDAVDDQMKITPHGKKLLDYPLHPRLSHALCRSHELGISDVAKDIVSILSERDFIVSPPSADIAIRLEAVRKNIGSLTLNRSTLERVKTTRKRFDNNLKSDTKSCKIDFHDSAGLILALAYPDRIARLRDQETREYTLSNGVSARLLKDDLLIHNEYLAAAETTTNERGTIIRLATPLDIGLVRKFMPGIIEKRSVTRFDRDKKSVIAESVESISSLVISRKNDRANASDTDTAKALAEGIRFFGIQSLNFSSAATSYRERVNFLRYHNIPDMPDLSDQTLLDTLEEWLVPYIGKITRIDDLAKLDYKMIFEGMTGRVSNLLNNLAPERIEVPTGSKIRVDYSDPLQPSISVRLQELFGMMKTPVIANGRVNILMDILSPGMRTVQKTSNLESFWRESYFLVRKDMRGRYPKHDWPENPLEASAHRGTKRKTPPQT